MIRKWNFPEILTGAILQHHKLDFTELDDPALVNLTAVTPLADLFCLKLGIGIREPQEDIDLVASKAGQMLKITEQNVDQMLEVFDKAFAEDKALFTS